MFHESFKEVKVSRMLQGFFMILKGVSKVFQGSFKKTFKVFQKSFMFHGTHCSFPSRRRACLDCVFFLGYFHFCGHHNC